MAAVDFWIAARGGSVAVRGLGELCFIGLASEKSGNYSEVERMEEVKEMYEMGLDSQSQVALSDNFMT